ncbi:RNA polymerase sigma factor SigJ [Streptomyces sp. BI20]|uniref:RNA polymerase sigma factor SigJ n=1 Tax=Streptomyces sp. BI20 TaxID=3403460 RepID=UPI003C786CD8
MTRDTETGAGTGAGRDTGGREAGAELFEGQRRRLFAIAYRITGGVADAEDLVQEAWIRWDAADREAVENPPAWLARVVTNLALNRLDSAAARRVTYVGPWLPEPLVTAAGAAEPADGAAAVELADSVSTAVMVVLESLSPVERAVFVLHEVFGYPYREVASILDRSEPSVRQTGHRAKAAVRARRPRFEAPAGVRRAVTDEFLTAATGGDLHRMLGLLAPDVTLWTDGGGLIRAAVRPVSGPENVVRFLLGVLARPEVAGLAAEAVDVDGQPGVLLRLPDGSVDSVAVMECGADGRIAEVPVVRNPEKLRHL